MENTANDDQQPRQDREAKFTLSAEADRFVVTGEGLRLLPRVNFMAKNQSLKYPGMDKKIVSLAESKEWDAIEKLLKELSKQELRDHVINRVLKAKGEPIVFLRAVLQGSSVGQQDGVKRRLLIYHQCIDLLQRNELSSKLAADVIALLMLEADAFPALSLAELTNKYVDAIKMPDAQLGKSLELLPKLLSELATQKNVSYGNTSLTGPEYKSHVINSICSSRWESQNVTSLAAMFRDVTLTLDELRFVTEKIIRMFKDLDLPELPALVYQLLLLSTKGHRHLVLEGIVDFFNDQDLQRREFMARESENDLMEDSRFSGDTLSHTEGTVILHITFAIKQDPELGRQFVKNLKNGQQIPAQILTPFNVALSLAVTRIHRFEEQIFDMLKTTILKSYKDSEKQTQCLWLHQIGQDKCSVPNMMLETIENSVHGWDHVMHGLIQLGFLLMDSYGPKAVFGRVEATPVTLPSTPSQHACKLGAQIIINTFKSHQMARSEILDQIFNRVITKTTAPVSHYLDLLTNTVMAAPQILMDCMPKVREMFDYLAMLPPVTAEGLLKAIQPLLKLSVSLKDALMLVLRKAMFSRQLDGRKIAVMGCLTLLKHFRVLGGMPPSQLSLLSQSFSSQIQVDVHTRYNPSSNEALCLEILGNMKRCLTQQADIRLCLYEGVYEVLCRNSKLLGAILEMLLDQIKKYYVSSCPEGTPPLKLEQCIIGQNEQIYLAEPLSHLLCSIQLCLHQASVIAKERLTHDSYNEDDDEEDVDPNQTELEEILQTLTQRMSTCDMEDFELDKSANFSTSTSVGVRNNIFAILLLGVYEMLIEYNFHHEKLSTDSCESIVQLFEKYHKLSEIAKEKTSAAAGKKGRPVTGGGKSPRSLLSLHCVDKMMISLFKAREDYCRKFITGMTVSRAKFSKIVFSWSANGYVSRPMQKQFLADITVKVDTVPSHQDSLNILRQTEMCRYMASVAVQKLTQVRDRGVCDGAEGSNNEKLFTYICSLGRTLLKQYMENQNGGPNRRREHKAVTALCLEGFVIAMEIMCTKYSSRLVSALHSIDSSKDESFSEKEKEDKIQTHIKRYQKLVSHVMSTDDDEDACLKDVPPLLSVIGYLSKHVKTDSEVHIQALDWVKKLCTDLDLDDLPTSKQLIILLLDMTKQEKNCLPLLRDISQDIHSRLGDIDQEVEVETISHYKLITQRTAAPTVLLLMMHHVDREIDDTEWAIARVKAEAGQQKASTDDDAGLSQALSQREGHEKQIATRLGQLITAFHELVQSALPIGPCCDALLKNLARFYAVLTLLVKYYLALYNQRSGHLTSRFEKLVKLSGTHLTQQVYALITYIQVSGSEQVQQNLEKGRKDKKKAAAIASAGRAKVLKESKLIPSLIYSIEQYERFLIQLTKKSKINLMEHMKLSTSRDFRINVEKLQNALTEQEPSSDEDEETQDGAGNSTADVSNRQEQGEIISEEEEENRDPASNATIPRSVSATKKATSKLSKGAKKAKT